MKNKIDKIIYFIKDNLPVHKQLIDDYIIESENEIIFNQMKSNNTNITISGKLAIPKQYDFCYIIERPHDKEELRDLRVTSLFRPLFDRSFDGMKEVTVDPELDVYYKRYKIFGLNIDENGCGTYKYFIVNF